MTMETGSQDMTDKSPIHLNLRADALSAVNLARSFEETRYYLNGVFVTPWKIGDDTGVMMVATNGHILAAYFDAEGAASRPAIISGQFNASAMTTPRSERAPRRIEINGDVGRIMAVCKGKTEPSSASLLMVREIDGTFPNWQKVIPTPPTGPGNASFSWSHIVLSQVCKIAARVNGNQTVNMDAFQSSRNDPALFTFGLGCPLCVVAMPTRGDNAARSVGFEMLCGSPIDAAAKAPDLEAAE